MAEDRYIVVQGQGYYGPLFVAQDTQTGRLTHAPDYRYDIAQKVADRLNELELVRQERRMAGDNVWTPIVHNVASGARQPRSLVDKRRVAS